MNSAERALRAGQQAAEVGLGGEQLAQVVAGGAAPRLRVAVGDGLAVALAHLRERRRQPLPRRPAQAGPQVSPAQAPNASASPPASTPATRSTLSLLSPYTMEREPDELLPTMPPMVAWSTVEVSGPNSSPYGAAAG